MENELIKPINIEVDANRQYAHQQLENNLNAQILEITMQIRNHYPELCDYLDEMPIIPNEKNSPISLEHLQSYLESLILLITNYKKNHPIK